MAIPRSLKTDESFLEKIAMGATGTLRAFEDLKSQGHAPIELERGSMSFKIWKAIKIKRVRMADLLCLRCGHRVESRAKTKLEISMSHSTVTAERGWDYGLEDEDSVALVQCERSGEGPLDWRADPLVQYASVGSLRKAWQAGKVKVHQPKGSQEGFETWVTWPSRVASASGIVEDVGKKTIRYRRTADNRALTARLASPQGALQPLVSSGDTVSPNQFLASVAAVNKINPCSRAINVTHYEKLARSKSLSDRYTAAKALGHIPGAGSKKVLVRLAKDENEHIYVRVDAAAGLMRQADPYGSEFLDATLTGEYLERRLEAAIVLGEVGNEEADKLLIATVQDGEQHYEIRAGAAWALGEVGSRQAIPALTQSFHSMELGLRVEAARALAKVARKHMGDVVDAFPKAAADQRAGIAWALSRAGGYTIEQLLPALSDDDARHWVTFMLGSRQREEFVPDLELLAQSDPEIYFAATVLWKIMDSWVSELKEY